MHVVHAAHVGCVPEHVQIGVVHFGQQAVLLLDPRTAEHMIDVRVGEHKTHGLQTVLTEPSLQFMFLARIPTARIHNDGFLAIVQHVGVLLERIEGEFGDADHERKTLNFVRSRQVGDGRKIAIRSAVLRPLSPFILRSLFVVALAVSLLPARAQFYNGSQQEYGKNRVQYEDFLWQYYRFPELETYFYKGGRDVARYVSISATRHKKELEKFFDFTVDDRIQFIVYNSLGDFRQSNIGITGDDQYNIGGVTRIVGTKVFVYNEGDHMQLDRQVRSGIAELMIDQMMFGGNWREVLKNSTLLSLPE